MAKEMIFGTVGGLALFLYGMSQMSEGLQNPALSSALDRICSI